MTQVREHWRWRPGWAPGCRFLTFHFTFPDAPAVQQLAARVRERLAGFSALDLVPGQWLHLTTQGIGFADEVSEPDLIAITAAARSRLAALTAPAVTISAPRAASEGVASGVLPEGILNPARDALRSAIAGVWGPGRVPEPAAWSPHVSWAYASADADGAQYDTALAGLAPVTVTAAAAALIRLGRDQHLYQWETIAVLPLGQPSPGGSTARPRR